MDLSYGLGAAFTLDATINPDFGQVEADPAVINLSAFETFFDEQRPFFVEDARIFDFGLSGGRNQLFYSRRVGRQPSGSIPGDPALHRRPDEHVDPGCRQARGTDVRRALRRRARRRDGLRGRPVRVRRRHHGRVPRGAARPVWGREPRPGLQRWHDPGPGNGHRDERESPGDGSFDWLPSSAFNGGLRFEHQWSDREWALWGFLAGSHVRGRREAITRIQRASNHYFQRPDATRFDLDPTATVHLRRRVASPARATLGRLDRRVWAGEVTKGFEINDAGFSGTAERLDGGFRVGYREIQPGSLFRNYNINFFNYHNWSHEGFDDTWSLDSWKRARTGGSFNLNANGELLNYWSVRGNASYNPEQMSRSRTRGGPMMVVPASTSFSVNLDSDRRQRVSFGTNVRSVTSFGATEGATRSGATCGCGRPTMWNCRSTPASRARGPAIST
jgi:hypothetical protein